MAETGMDDALLDVLHEYWGYSEFRPLQQSAMTSVLEGRDSLVVLPTGGGNLSATRLLRSVWKGPRLLSAR